MKWTGGLVLLLALTACGSGGAQRGSGGTEQSPASAAKVLQTKVLTVRRVVDITEDNDPNGLIGRPNGYQAGEILYDSKLHCSELSVDCGAFIEQWGSVSAAKDRAAYIQGILKDSPILGSEYDYLDGSLLLRVAGELKPSDASAYATALGATAAE